MENQCYDCIIVGGGAVGALTLRSLTARGGRCLLLEAGADLASGATRANSAIVHAGFDPVPGTKKAYYNVRGAAMYPALADALDIPYRPMDSLVVAYSDAELGTLEKLYQRGVANGVREQRIIGREELLRREPNLSPNAVGALCAASALVEPWTVAISAAECAADNGADVRCGHRVTAIEAANGLFRVTAETETGTVEFTARTVVNAAGVHADAIHAMLAPKTYTITGKRGQYYVLGKRAAGIVNSVLFACPTEKGKGVLITPEIHGRILVGPDSEPVADRTDNGITADALELVRNAAARYLSVPLPMNLQIRTFAGVRPVGDTGDFVIGPCEAVPGFFEAACIESPGLASSPAIGEAVASQVAGFLGLRGGAHFVPVRRPRLTDGGTGDTLVCRCNRVTRAQIVDAIHRNCGARTVKGVKLRTGAMLGECQGGFCSGRIAAILAEELKTDLTQIRYDGPGSRILTERTRGE